ncbi:ankyrin repeat domain-containing protein [Scytonema sp. NUACC26]|uniref:ankyrin repeat domain-containing protein n=1 Tax=Scytonema sp. NUACC26 TaxID=3140176 RepID=UPI0034DC5884
MLENNERFWEAFDINLFSAIKNSKIEKIQNTIIKGVNLEQTGYEKLTPLQLALTLGDFEIVKIFVNAGVNVNNTVNGYSPLEIAVSSRKIKIVKFLIESGANLNYQNLSGWTPLMVAIDAGCDDIARLLIDAGADINIVNDDNHTALNIALRENRWKIVEYLLPLLSLDEQKYAKEQLQYRRSHQGKRLLVATRKGKTDIVKKVLKTEINIEDIGAALILASNEGYKDIVGLLLESDIDVNYSDKNECNALMYAAKNCHLEIVNILLKAGANSNLKNKEGYTALTYAQESGHTEIENLLLGTDVLRQ